MNDQLNQIIEKLQTAKYGDENYNIAKNALVKFYKEVHNCTHPQAEKAVDKAASDDQMNDWIDHKPEHLLGLAKGMLFIAKDTSSVAKTRKSDISMPNPRKVFVVHGRNSRLRDDFFNFLRSIKLEPIEWSEAIKLTRTGTPYIGEILDNAFLESQAIIVLLTPDDEVKLKVEFINNDDPPYEKELTGQARPNVLFEAGMAFGKNPHKTILVAIGNIKPFSDIGGRHIIRLDNSSSQRQEVAAPIEIDPQNALICPNCLINGRTVIMSPIPTDFVEIENATHECNKCKFKKRI
ncbi:MAG: nucleotide-binding protein [Deltaproteobacteria bacterium]|nr:nucleotide-binding protein [Deltaproteobacteria bacterium]